MASLIVPVGSLMSCINVSVSYMRACCLPKLTSAHSYFHGVMSYRRRIDNIVILDRIHVSYNLVLYARVTPISSAEIH